MVISQPVAAFSTPSSLVRKRWRAFHARSKVLRRQVLDGFGWPAVEAVDEAVDGDVRLPVELSKGSAEA